MSSVISASAIPCDSWSQRLWTSRFSSGIGRHRGHVDVLVAEAIPMFLRARIRRMRLAERDRHEEGLPILLAGQVVDLLRGEVLDLVVVVHLHAAHARARLEDVPHADSGRLVRRAGEPIGRPGEVRGIDVGREPFIEAVKLVGADEVHLPERMLRYPPAAR
jgi:hypothetical protein